MLALFLASTLSAQWARVTPATVSMRGISVGRDGSLWASAERGIVLRSSDDGQSWSVDSIGAAHSFDLRGIIALDRQGALAMAAGADTARIYRTRDGGRSWSLAYDDTRKGVFLDGIAAWDARALIALGDPIDGAFMVLVSHDSGAHWAHVRTPPTLPGEAAFAASNTSLTTGPGGAAWFVTGGGTVSRIFHTRDYGQAWTVDILPIPAGNASSGAFSIAVADRHAVVVGGDYAHPDSVRVNVARSDDGGETWIAAPDANVPYLSAVASVGNHWIGTGTRGTWMSRDGGRTWTSRDTSAYNAVGVTSHRVVLVGPRGAIASTSIGALLGASR